MDARKEHYLAQAASAKTPTTRAFCEMMAEMAPVLSSTAVRLINQMSPADFYAAVLRVAAALILETLSNLRGARLSAEELDALAKDFRTIVAAGASSQKVISSVNCTPHFDA